MMSQLTRTIAYILTAFFVGALVIADNHLLSVWTFNAGIVIFTTLLFVMVMLDNNKLPFKRKKKDDRILNTVGARKHRLVVASVDLERAIDVCMRYQISHADAKLLQAEVSGIAHIYRISGDYGLRFHYPRSFEYGEVLLGVCEWLQDWLHENHPIEEES